MFGQCSCIFDHNSTSICGGCYVHFLCGFIEAACIGGAYKSIKPVIVRYISFQQMLSVSSDKICPPERLFFGQT